MVWYPEYTQVIIAIAVIAAIVVLDHKMKGGKI